MANLRIEDYALIGDCATAALVGRNGSIDWLCLPRWRLASANVLKRAIPLKKSSFEVIAAVRIGGATTAVSAASPQVAAIGAGTGISLASLRRFWAVAARWNSSRAPFGPRNRNRSSFRMRFRCANSISTFFLSRLEVT
jgi:hypothetical protein